MKALFFILAALLATSFLLYHKQPSTLQYTQAEAEAYKSWSSKYNQANTGDIDQQVYRYEIFCENLKKIQQHNAQNSAWQMGENQFMTQTQEEFVSKNLGLNTPADFQEKPYNYVPGGSQNAAIDWKSKGVLSSVKNQGSCGSCYAFSALETLTSVHAIATGEKVEYSEQQIVDCSGDFGNMGCSGGVQSFVYEYILANGIETEHDYPYVGAVQSCRADESKFLHPLSSYKEVGRGDCQDLENQLAERPIAVAVDASTWQFYAGGVLSDCGVQLNHGVVLVGLKPSNYYMIQNSWGLRWGEGGFIRISAGGDTCGICQQAFYPIA